MRWTLGLTLLLGGFAALPGQVKDPADPAGPEMGAVEAVLYANLKETINRGVDLYNGGDIPGCYRLFEGTLRTLKPLLKHKPKLVEVIDDKLATAEREAVVWRKAFALRAALDKVRSDLRPRDAAEALGPKAAVKKPEEFDPLKADPVKPDDKKKATVDPDDKAVIPEIKRPPVPDDKKKAEDEELRKALEEVKRKEAEDKKKADDEAAKKKDDKGAPNLLKQPKELPPEKGGE